MARRLLSTSKICDVLVIGSGIVGSSTALSLSKLGYDVKVIDKNPYHGLGSSSFSSGICRMFYTHIDSVKLSWDSYQFWYRDRWEDFIGGRDPRGMVGINECGCAYLKTANSLHFIDKTTTAMDEVGVPFDVLDLEETKKLLSPLGVDLDNSYKPSRFDDESFGIPIGTPVYGSLYMEKTGYISDPNLANLNLQYGSQLLGTEYFYNKEVTGFLFENSSKNYEKKMIGVTINNNEKIYADNIINCSGLFSSKLNSMVYKDIPSDIRIATRPMKQEVCYIDVDDSVDIANDGLFLCDPDTGVHFRPETGNKFLVGNSEPDCDEFHWINDIDKFDDSFSQQYQEQVYRACLRIPSLKLPTSTNLRGVVSGYDVTDDWTPIYDKSNIENYFMAIGTSGNQFKNAANIGNIMSSIIENVENHDISPTQFSMVNFDDTIDLSSFSRLRTVLPNSNCVFS